jgi:N-acetylglucosamine-6-phosphate deacetylase
VVRLSTAGIVASVGHTDGNADLVVTAYEAGARSTTHLFNGMPPLHHREPGPVGAALASAPFIELICDGVHIDARLLAPIARAIGDDRLILVSDALPGGQRLRSIGAARARPSGGRAVTAAPGGSRLPLDGMVEEAVRAASLCRGARAATENPARLLGLDDRGTIRPGATADFVVVSRAGRLRRVLPADGPPQPPTRSTSPIR